MAAKKNATSEKGIASKKIKTTELSSITQLFQESWKLFKRTWISYVKLVGLGFAYIILAVLIGVLIALPIIFIAVGSHFQIFQHLTLFNIVTLVLLSFWFILFFLSIIAIEIIFPIISILILQEKKVESLIVLMKQGKSYFWMYFLTSLLAWFVVIGSLGLFVIPGVFIVFCFTFVTYEVVLENQSGTAALQRSYYLVKSHFWEVMGRLLLIEAIVGIMSSVVNRIAFDNFFLVLVYLLYTLFIGWYVRAYIFLLYKQLRTATSVPQKISIRWIWLVTAIGWFILIVFLVALIISGWHFPWMQQRHSHIPQNQSV
ncbi:MAG TPA: hypothetical protein VNW29_06065 [Candidatus Sulfotelmatobacter sp.]|jgi:hypothetical protein|nr:hypothetical protein [Candidatus Sulfotelmatobacter sp.]